MTTTPQDLFRILETLDISYINHSHEPIFTVQEGLHLKAKIPGTHCRNMFLKDKKNQMFLITAANETKIDLKKLHEILGCGRLSFGSAERLWQYLAIKPGSVSPFCALNDKDRAVTVILDATMMHADIINVHPLDNAMTVSLAPHDLLKFFNYTGHIPRILELPA